MRLIEEARARGTDVVAEVFEEVQRRFLEEVLREELPSGELRFVKDGLYEKPLKTTLGAIVIRIQRLKDRLLGVTVSPFLDALGIRRLTYGRDVRLACAEEATRTSYGEAEQAFQRITGIRVPKRTIWNFVQDLAGVVEGAHRAEPVPTKDKPVLPDGIKVRSRKRGGHHEVNIAVVQHPDDHRAELIDVKVNGPPKDVLKGVEVTQLVRDDDLSFRVLVARFVQVCLRHFKKYVYKLLLVPGTASKEERDHWMSILKKILGKLVASTKKHREDKDFARLAWRVKTTLKELRKLATRIENAGLYEAAKYIREDARATVVAAEAATRGIWMPSTTNGIERTCGTVAERCKNKWAHWGSGLRNMVVLLLVRKTRPHVYARVTTRYLAGSA